jgi:endoglucanase Acf2
LRDPQWAASEQWGGIVDLLIADIATAKRDGAPFPFLRTFDPYEGHSWASGIGLGAHGNNQESSSEAVNAWAGLILWGEIKGDTALRDLGMYLYTTEIEAINHYWFDLHGLVFAPEYKNVEVSMLFGGMYAHNTWWIDDPRQIKGINLLPITTVSTYLGQKPEFVKKNVASLVPETAVYNARGKFSKPIDIWQDIFAKYEALADPDQALVSWKRWGSFELGDTRTHALHWIQSLKEMGIPDFSVTADTTLYAVFKQPNGQRTYLAFNAGKNPVTVRFSNGASLVAQPGKLARLAAP